MDGALLAALWKGRMVARGAFSSKRDHDQNRL